MEQGLGGHRVFDPRNADYSIIDKLQELEAYSTDLRRSVSIISRLGGLSGVGSETKIGPAVKGTAKVPTSKHHWAEGFWGDQQSTSACTGFAAAHLLADGPVTHGTKKGTAVVDPFVLYQQNQANDRKMGYNFAEGATSLAMAMTLKQLGYIESYHWGYDLNSLVQAALIGPVCIGINWLEGMDNPDRKYGMIRAIGRNRGGHEILVNGVDLDDGMFRLKNSWGRSWGRNGHAIIPFEDIEKLLGQGGEVLMTVERKRPVIV